MIDDQFNEENLPENHKSGFVAVVGRPNVGKSTLVNALLQQKIAIVTPRPQTTRTKQLGIITEPDHQIIFVDTPGFIRKPRHKLDEYMVEVALEAVGDTDVVVWMVDGSERPAAEDLAIGERLQHLPADKPVILAINKIDKLKPQQVLERSDTFRALLPDVPWLMFSAETGAGTDALYAQIIEALPPGPRFYPADQVTDLYMRTIAAEMIREQILLQLRDEIPHAVAVLVNDYKERDNGVTYIGATVYVERDSHKKIIIGRKGSQLSAIGTAARKEIETLIEGRVFLELFVKVETKWRRNEHVLKQLGYASEK
jgi:GTP-binding protein Era